MKVRFSPKAGLFPLILCALCVQVLAQTRSRVRPAAQPQHTSKIAKDLQILGFTLGKSTLADVETKLGKSELRRCAIEEEEVCYLAGTSQTKMVLEAVPGGCLVGFRVTAGSLRDACYRGVPEPPI